MASVVETVDVAVPVARAYNQWTQFESFPHFMTGVESVTQLDNTHLHWKVRVGGHEREFDTEITEQHPDERVAWRSTDGTTHSGEITFARIDDENSQVTANIHWEPEGLAELIGAAIGADNRQVKTDLHRFKEFIELQGRATGAWRGDVDPGTGAAPLLHSGG